MYFVEWPHLDAQGFVLACFDIVTHHHFVAVGVTIPFGVPLGCGALLLCPARIVSCHLLDDGEEF